MYGSMKYNRLPSSLKAVQTSLLLVLLLLLSNISLLARDDIRENSVREVFDLYRIKISSYCEDYNWTDRLDIQEYLLTSQEIDFSSDIPGLELYQLSASDYFHFLSQEKVNITYAEDYFIEECSSSPPVYGVRVEKNILTKSGELHQYEEYLEVHLDGQNEARIHAVASSRYSAYQDIECEKEQTPEITPTQPSSTSPPKPADCTSFAEAEAAKAAGSIPSAITLYEDAIKCGFRVPYIQEQLQLLRTRATIDKLLAEGKIAQAGGDYKVAISTYESLLSPQLVSQLTAQEATLVRENLKTVREDLAYVELVATGDYHFQNQSYQKAKIAYQRAVATRPGEAALTEKIRQTNLYLEGAYRRNAQREISLALQKLKRNYRYDDDVLLTLEKYTDTGWLSGEALFYLTQMMDGISARARKRLGLTSRDVCVKTKLLLRQTRATGYQSQAFTDFKEYHLNNHSKTCN